MTRAGMTLRDWESGRLDSRSLIHFIRWLGPDSAYFRATHEDEAETIAWVDGSAVCALLAELIDAVRSSASTLAYKGTGKRAPRIEPYERPWKRKGAKRYGNKPIPIKSFDEWYYGGDA